MRSKPDKSQATGFNLALQIRSGSSYTLQIREDMELFPGLEHDSTNNIPEGTLVVEDVEISLFVGSFQCKIAGPGYIPKDSRDLISGGVTCDPDLFYSCITNEWNSENSEVGPRVIGFSGHNSNHITSIVGEDTTSQDELQSGYIINNNSPGNNITMTAPEVKGNITGNVVNLSSHALDNNAISLLVKGLGFVLAPKKNPIDDFICNIEVGIKNLLEH